MASGMFAVTAVSFAPPAGAAANNPVSATLGFNIFVEGNAELNQNESEGAVAIGGDLKMNNGYQVAFVAGAGVTVAGTGGGSNVGLVVGGKVDFAHSTGHVYVQNSTNVILGDASNGTFTYLGAGQSNDFRSGGSPGTDPLLRTGGNLTTGTPINFSTQFATLRQYSANMAALNPTDCPTSANIQLLNDAGNAPWSSGNATVKLTANKTNVFNTNLTALSAIPGWGHDDPSQTQPLVINISDAGVINLAARDLGAIQNGASYVLWNFPNATAVNITSGHFWGSLFAPNADVSGTGGAFFEGNVVAKTFVSATGAGETHRNHMADFTVDCLDTATTTTTGATTTTPRS